MNTPSENDALVVFTPSGKRGHFPLGTPLLDCARRLGVDIDSVCGGRGICGRCKVSHPKGHFDKFAITSQPENLTPLSENENRYDAKKGLAPDHRLSCSAKLQGDVVIDVPPESQVHRQLVRKRAEAREIKIDPAIHLYFLSVTEPDMHDPRGDFERLQAALAEQWELTEISAIDLPVLGQLQKALRAGQWQVTVAVDHDTTIMAIWPGFHDAIYGIAIDVGSTTVAAHLCDLATGEVLASEGVMNPQIRFGEDLMSRVSYIMMNPGGDQEMTTVIRGALDNLASGLSKSAGIPLSSILSLTLVGNPVMHHLLLGIDPIELGGAPFALSSGSAQSIWARDLELNRLIPNGRVYILPCIAGHVGADAAAVVLSEGPHLRDEISLICDVGTNAEIILGNNRRLLAASSPTGPAFEGAQISCGQRAAPGAIERVRIDPQTLEPRFKIIGSDLWSDEDGFSQVALETGITGICGSGVIEVIAEMFLSGLLLSDGTINGQKSSLTERIQAEGRTFSYLLHSGDVTITVTQNDIRAIQLAKAALYAGARLLMDHMEIERVDRIVLAGAFGSHIDVKYAMVLGMIPDCDLSKVSSAGNAAGTGARIALLNKQSRSEIETIVHGITKIETAVEPRFQEHFVEAMAFPHKTQPYPELSKVVALPETTQVIMSGTDKPKRRRRWKS